MSLNVATVKLFCISRNQFLKDLCSGTQCVGFQFLLILFNSVLGHCVQGCKCMTALLADKKTRQKVKQNVFKKHIYM